MNDLIEIQVRIQNQDTGKSSMIHHKTAHALSLRDGGVYPNNQYMEAVAASFRYHERLKNTY
jgi:hypothetical protein